MKKFAKKLALVLALVLAFACVAPATTQALAAADWSWSFSTESKPTKTMSVGESFDFTMLRNGADISNNPNYTVTYVADNAALAIDATTGVATAKAPATGVKVKGYAKNIVSGDSKTIWAIVDITGAAALTVTSLDEAVTVGTEFNLVAMLGATEQSAIWAVSGSAVESLGNGKFKAVAAGTATITAVANGATASTVVAVTAPAVVVPAEPELVDVQQYSQKVFRFTFSEAIALSKADVLVKRSAAEDGTYTKAGVLKVTAVEPDSDKKSDVWDVELLNSVTSKYLNFYYNGDLYEAGPVLASDKKIAEVVCNTTTMFARTELVDNLTDVKLTFLDANGVIVFTTTAQKATENTAIADLSLDFDNENVSEYANQLMFEEPDMSVELTINVILNDEDDTAISTTAIIDSIAEESEIYDVDYFYLGEKTKAAKDVNGYKFAGNNLTIRVGEGKYVQLYAKGVYAKTDTETDMVEKSWLLGTSDELALDKTKAYVSTKLTGNADTSLEYYYVSSDNSKLLVDENGVLLPIAESEEPVEVILYKAPVDVDDEPLYINSCFVKVDKQVTLTSATALAQEKYVSNTTITDLNGNTVKDSINIKITAKDNYRADYKLAKGTSEIKDVSILTGPSNYVITNTAKGVFWNNNAADNMLYINGDVFQTVGNYTVKITLANDVTCTAKFRVKAANTGTTTPSYEVDPNKYDIAVADSDDPVVKEYTIFKLDSDGFRVGTVELAGRITSSLTTDNAGTLVQGNLNKFYYMITGPKTIASETAYVSGGKLMLRPYTNVPDSAAIELIPNGNYAVKLYQVVEKAGSYQFKELTAKLAIAVNNTSNKFTVVAKTKAADLVVDNTLANFATDSTAKQVWTYGAEGGTNDAKIKAIIEATCSNIHFGSKGTTKDGSILTAITGSGEYIDSIEFITDGRSILVLTKIVLRSDVDIADYAGAVQNTFYKQEFNVNIVLKVEQQ